MLKHTEGIVIKATKYSETSLVTQIFTREYGMQAFMVKGVYRKKSPLQPSHFQHLNRVQLEGYFKSGRQLQTIKELTINPLFESIPFEIEKTSLAIFISEVLQKTIREEEPNEDLFQFLTNLIQLLDQWRGSLANFPHFFLIKLSQFLGFFPLNNFQEDHQHFNLLEGYFQSTTPEEQYAINPPDTQYLNYLLNLSADSLDEIPMPLASRQHLLNKLLDYFRLHLEEFSRVKSANILREVFHS